MDAEAVLSLRGLLGLCLFVGVVVFGWLAWRSGAARRDFSSGRQAGEAALPTIDKQPIAFASHTFNPAAPPTVMPQLRPGETAACDSDFQASANVRGMSRQTDGTHATLRIRQVKVTLGLSINIWVPTEASQQVIEHEDGHRQISEYYYLTADKLAERIAARYLGRRVDISGGDLSVESSKVLGQMAAEITAEYNRELNPGPTQLLYDSITDHGRNEVVVKDAVEHAIKNVAVESPQAAINPGN
jgi:hypothetical protein